MYRKSFIVIILSMVVIKLSGLELPPVFSDNMVLQQKSEIRIWGTSAPEVLVTIEADWGEKTSTKSDKEGNWITNINTPEAGGPYIISIKTDKDEITIRNILIGEVWLCSGQSNMEMPLNGWPPNDLILNSDEEIKNATYPAIRYLNIPRNYSIEEITEYSSEWVECTPENAQVFSATAYFFAKTIHKELNIPVGIIVSSWGGTPVEAWMNIKTLEEIDEFKEQVKQIKESGPFINKLNLWLSEQDVVYVNKDNDKDWINLKLKDSEMSKTEYDDSKWDVMELPVLWEETDMLEFDGIVWFRKKITIPEDWQGKDLVLELGPIDDMDISYFNGERIGEKMGSGFWALNRKYKINKELVKTGENLIAVRVIDHGGGGGLYGRDAEMKIFHENNPDIRIDIAGSWKYLPVAEYRGDKLYCYKDIEHGYESRPELKYKLNQNTPSCLYNAMIHPVIPYTIKGVIWYQGESNMHNTGSYNFLFSKMITTWRELWGQGDFPFYYVQIAPYYYKNEEESYKIREAQLQTLSTPNTGMAITLDIGDSVNIHPANKQEVGRRLALWALTKDYRRNMVFSGPLYSSMKTERNKIILSFDYVNSGLTTKDGKLEHFLIAGEDRKFVSAKAEIKGDQVVVYSEKIDKPVAVRYLWDNTSYASLFNKDGLPASSFRTDTWDD